LARKNSMLPSGLPPALGILTDAAAGANEGWKIGIVGNFPKITDPKDTRPEA
jgi:hypothetical protein